MANNNTVIAQFMKLIPGHAFDSLAKRHPLVYGVKSSDLFLKPIEPVHALTRIMKFAPLVALILLSASCTSSDRLNFRTMSTEELAQYNQPLKYEDQIVCLQQVRIGSHIKQTVCQSRLQHRNREAGVTGQLEAISFDSTTIQAF